MLSAPRVALGLGRARVSAAMNFLDAPELFGFAAGYDRDLVFQAEVKNAALTLMEAVEAKRSGRLVEPGSQLEEPRPK